MSPHEMEVIRPFVLPVLILVVSAAIFAVATTLAIIWGRKPERRTWRFRALLGTLSGLSALFYLASSAVLEYAASRLGYEAEWTVSVFVQYAVEIALITVVAYISQKNLRLAHKGYVLEKMLKP